MCCPTMKREAKIGEKKSDFNFEKNTSQCFPIMRQLRGDKQNDGKKFIDSYTFFNTVLLS